MSIPAYRRSRFDDGDEDPMGPLANLADIMLVFAVGLMVALAASQRSLDEAPQKTTDVSSGREIPELPAGVGESGSGYEAMGQVYRDPETGRMILVGP
ncbi:MAG: DUF2149 domain-containing protein [Oleiphilaceae bacterium]|nr:DUF2149 domain-containing protein [Oleiphilaceae bacterium]